MELASFKGICDDIQIGATVVEFCRRIEGHLA